MDDVELWPLVVIAAARIRAGDDVEAVLLEFGRDVRARLKARPSVPAGAWSDDEVTPVRNVWEDEHDTVPPGADYDAREMDRRAGRRR